MGNWSPIAGVAISKRLLAIGLLALCVLSASASVAAAADDPSFDSDTVEVQENETATVNVTVGDADEIPVRFGDEDQLNYELTGTIDPGEAETVTIRIDPYATADSESPISVAGDASLDISSESELESALDPASYELAVLESNADGESVIDETNVVVAAADDRNENAVEASDDPVTPTDRGWILLENDSAETIALEPAGATEGDQLEVRLSAPGVFVVTESTTVNESGVATVTFDLEDHSAPQRAEFAVRGDEANVSEDYPVYVTAAGQDGDRSTTNADTILENASSASVALDVDAETGTELDVMLVSPEQFVRESTATVDQNGTVQAAFDLDGVDAGVGATLSAYSADELVEERSVAIVDAGNTTEGTEEAQSNESASTSASATESTESTNDSIPGFGIVATLAALGIAAGRRRG
ncbi:BGTF surface domain-containing protein [Halopiger aswanensis]|uniref:PGF-CTERM protein n=1 Tax=Halopiger aswanensis TaxID=148449 RepID=A0A3R7KJT9_9EURY|nr:BGTF surface domain-containing protein [Halopiger aswanensis]RKD93650.1 PGF-CTERM protein [Halopiger aswanensis]